MARTEKLRPVMIAEQGRGNGPLFIAAALVAMGIAYVLLLAHPGLVHGVSALWQRIPGSSSAAGWMLPAVAAGIAIGGTAIGVALLSAFVRGVQAHPFAWLAPVLVGFSSLVMTGLPIDLPWQGVSLRLFVVLAGLAMLGGGAVMQMRGLASIAAGTLLLLLPMFVLLAGYAAMPAALPTVLSGLDTSSQLFLFVVALTSVGIGFMAVVTERSSHAMAMFRDQRLYVAEALERARSSEERAVQAEHRAQIAEQQLRGSGANPWNIPPVSEAEASAFAAMARPGMSASAIVAGALLVLAVVVGGLYAGLYRPLERKAAAQHAFVASAAKEHATEIDALRKHFQAQQAGLQAELAAERAKAAEAPAAAEPARPQATQAVQPAPQPTGGAAPAVAPQTATAKASSRAEPRRAGARKTSAARRPPRKAEPSAANAVVTPPKAAAEPELDRETRRALRESVDDDPIGGLE